MTYEERRFFLAWKLLDDIAVARDGTMFSRIVRLLPSEEVFYNRPGEHRRFAELKPDTQGLVLAMLGLASLNDKSRLRMCLREGHFVLEFVQMFGDGEDMIANGETMYSKHADSAPCQT